MPSTAFRIVCLLLLTQAGLGRDRSWVEVRTPNFTVFSDAGPGRARKVAGGFEELRAAVKTTFPDFRTELGRSVHIFAAKNRDTFRHLLGEHFRSQGRRFSGEGRVEVVGMYFPGESRDFVVVRLDMEGRDFPFSPIYHEYLHALNRVNFEYLPFWLDEGLADFFSQTRVLRSRVEVGHPPLTRLRTLRGMDPIPLFSFLGVTPDAPEMEDARRSQEFLAQAWAVTHFLMFDRSSRGSKAMESLLQDLAQGKTALESLEASSGDLEIFHKELARYFGRPAFQFMPFDVQARVDTAGFEARRVGAERMRCRVSELWSMSEQGHRVVPPGPEAGAVECLNAMGHRLFQEGSLEGALQWFEKSRQQDPNDYVSAYYVGLMRSQQDVPWFDIEEAESQLRLVVRQQPSFVPGLAALAQVLLVKKGDLDEGWDLLRRARAQEPGWYWSALLAVRYLERMGRLEPAAQEGRRLLRIMPDARSRQMMLDMIRQAERARP